jgi:hypothetical protein
MTTCTKAAAGVQSLPTLSPTVLSMLAPAVKRPLLRAIFRHSTCTLTSVSIGAPVTNKPPLTVLTPCRPLTRPFLALRQTDREKRSVELRGDYRNRTWFQEILRWPASLCLDEPQMLRRVGIKSMGWDLTTTLDRTSPDRSARDCSFVSLLVTPSATFPSTSLSFSALSSNHT